MKLGAFSISLSVKDLGVSKAFYEKLGFEVCRVIGTALPHHEERKRPHRVIPGHV